MRYPVRFVFGWWGFDPALDAERVRLAVEVLAAANEALFRARPELPGVYESQVRYFRPEPDDEDDDFDDWAVVLERGYGDCEDLAAARIAELRVRHGIAARAGFTRVVVQTPEGPQERVHTWVMHPDGTSEDVSRALGM